MLNGDYSVVLSKVGTGLGIAKNQVYNLAKNASDEVFEKVLKSVPDVVQKIELKQIREIITSCWETKSCSFKSQGIIFSRFSKNQLISTANLPDRNSFTKVGRALQKHSSREGSLFKTTFTKTKDINQDAIKILQDILDDPLAVSYQAKAKSVGDIIDIRQVSGRGARYTQNGEFIGFLDLFKK